MRVPMTYIFGAGGNALCIANLLLDLRMDISGFVADIPTADEFLGIKVFSYSEFTTLRSTSSCVISVGHNTLRRKIHHRIKEDSLSKVTFPSLIHPTAYVSKSVEIGMGSILYPNVSIGPNCKLSDFVLINTNSIIEHETTIDDYASLAPGAVAGGNVRIGRESAILMNATVSNRINVGEEVVVGANSFLKTSTGSNELWAGSPATLKRKRTNLDTYF